MAVARLTFSSFRQHKTRIVLTVLSIALAASLVVAVTSGYASLRAAVLGYFNEFMGSTDIEIVRRPGAANGGEHFIDEALVEQLQSDPEVGAAVGRLSISTEIVNRLGVPLPIPLLPPASITGVRPDRDFALRNLRLEEGQWFTSARGNEAVSDQETPRLLKTKLGGEIAIPMPGKKLRVKLVGTVHKPQILAFVQQTVYVPLETLQEFAGAQGKVSRILVQLRRGADEDEFARRWTARIAAIDPALRIKSSREARKELERHIEGLELLSYLGGSISMLAATFLIFATLSMGVAERQRSLAMLRAIGASRWQIAAMVTLEGVLLALVGGLIGLPLGLLWVKLTALYRPEIFRAGVVPHLGGMLYGTLGSALAALLASCLPAWNAARLSPIEGISAIGQPRRSRVPLWAALGGIVLASIDPVLMFAPGIPRHIRFYGHFIVGLPGVLIGFFLLAPAFVWAIEKTFGPIVSGILRVRYRLVAHQLTGSLWRATGTAAALMVGLAILVVMHTQGNSALRGWRLPDKFPDIFIFAPAGLDPAQVTMLEKVQGVRKSDVLPVAIAPADLPSGFLERIRALTSFNATLFVGADPDQALRMLDLEFRQGDAKSAAAMLKKGGHIIITEELHQMRKLNVGDTLSLKNSAGQEHTYTIAGVVWSPGIDVVVNMFDMGQQAEQHSIGTVFGSLDDARRDFHVQKLRFFAANLDTGVQKDVLRGRISQQLGDMGLMLGDVRQIKHGIQHGFRKLLALVSTVALMAIAVASLGVTNTIMASIRSRRWQLGILRSVGLTRGQLLRLILAEAVLIGLVGCALGLAAGFEMSLNANALSRQIIGYGPPIVFPWGVICGGAGIVLGVAVIASIIPAIRTARQEPLELLQAGRAAA